MRLHSLRLSFACSATLLAVGTVMVACNNADPNECFVNSSGGFGGSGTIPIGAGVGVGSGDFASPRFGPLDYGSSANPCDTPSDDTTGAGGSSAATDPEKEACINTYERCQIGHWEGPCG